MTFAGDQDSTRDANMPPDNVAPQREWEREEQPSSRSTRSTEEGDRPPSYRPGARASGAEHFRDSGAEHYQPTA
ncbi:MAG: hypothetical protein ACUVRV_02540, partial [Cyanobacteriota bacterium]